MFSLLTTTLVIPKLFHEVWSRVKHGSKMLMVLNRRETNVLNIGRCQKVNRQKTRRHDAFSLSCCQCKCRSLIYSPWCSSSIEVRDVIHQIWNHVRQSKCRQVCLCGSAASGVLCGDSVALVTNLSE